MKAALPTLPRFSSSNASVISTPEASAAAISSSISSSFSAMLSRWSFRERSVCILVSNTPTRERKISSTTIMIAALRFSLAVTFAPPS